MNRYTLAALLGSLGTAGSVSAEVVDFTIDATRSTLTASGQLAGSSAAQQTSGSKTIRYLGSVRVDLTASTIQFLPDLTVWAANQSAKQQPDVDGMPGSANANYGLYANGMFATAYAAMRSLSLDFRSDSIALSGTQFDAASVTSDITYGKMDFQCTSFGSRSFAGKFASNTSATAGSLVTQDGTQTLTLPVTVDFGSYSVQTSDDSTFALSGTLVATRSVPVPEPASAVALVALALPLLRRRRR